MHIILWFTNQHQHVASILSALSVSVWTNTNLGCRWPEVWPTDEKDDLAEDSSEEWRACSRLSPSTATPAWGFPTSFRPLSSNKKLLLIPLSLFLIREASFIERLLKSFLVGRGVGRSVQLILNMAHSSRLTLLFLTSSRLSQVINVGQTFW